MTAVPITPKKAERLRKKIADIKRMLAAEKKKFGGYDDSRGHRYVPTRFFIELGDYNKGLLYTKWFQKNFPDDIGYPEFLFEWTLILFKTGKVKEAEKKALETFMSNVYLFDKFLEKTFLKLDIYEGSEWERVSSLADFNYNKNRSDLLDFVDWLSTFLISQPFYIIANEYIRIQQQLQTEPVGPSRNALIDQSNTLLDEYK